MKRISPAWMVTAAVGAGALALAAACSSTDGPDAPPITNDCQGPSCLPTSDAGAQETSVKKEAGTDGAADVSADVQLVTQEGRLFKMKEPLFEPFLSSDTPFLSAPAQVSLGANGQVFTATSDHDGGFVLKDVPKVEGAPLMISDIDGGAGIYATLWPANVPSQSQSGSFDIAVLPKDAIEQIVSSVTPPVTLDPAKGHLLVTMLNSTLDPTGTPFAKLAPSKAAEAVIYLSAGNTWVRDDQSGTGPSGTALVVNIEALQFPGETLKIKYTASGVSGVMVIPHALKLAAGAINRVYFYAADATPE